jgi:hypothetical protein
MIMKRFIAAAALIVPAVTFAGTVPVVDNESTLVPPILVPGSSTGGSAPGTPAAGTGSPVATQAISALATSGGSGPIVAVIRNMSTAQLNQVVNLLNNILGQPNPGAGGIPTAALSALQQRIQTELASR